MGGILKISEAVSLGIHACIIIAGAKPEKLSTHRIAEMIHASDHHLAKVMQRLVKSGLIHSVRGPKGGFTLARPASDIVLLDIYRAVEGDFPCQACLFDQPVCQDMPCPMGNLLVKVNREVKEYFETTSLDKLLAGEG